MFALSIYNLLRVNTMTSQLQILRLQAEVLERRTHQTPSPVDSQANNTLSEHPTPSNITSQPVFLIDDDDDVNRDEAFVRRSRMRRAGSGDYRKRAGDMRVASQSKFHPRYPNQPNTYHSGWILSNYGVFSF